MGVFDLAEPKASHFLGFSIEILNKECFNVKTSCTRLPPRPKTAQTSYL